jgi:hypothetical protein
MNTTALATTEVFPVDDPWFRRTRHSDGLSVYYSDTAAELARDMLTWLDNRFRRVVLSDGDWFAYDPCTGKFAKLAGSTERQARAFIAEATAQLDAEFGRLDPLAQRIAANTGECFKEKWLFSNGTEETFRDIDAAERVYAARECLRGTFREDSPTSGQIASAMLDVAMEGGLARDVADRLMRGSDPTRLYHPMDAEGFDYTRSDNHAVCCGEGGVSDPDGIPLKAASYAPSYASQETPLWDELCSLVWPEEEVREAALRTLSMGFTGRATKYVIYWCAETGRGKSLMHSFMRDLLGDYGRKIPAKTLFGYSADPQRAAEELAGRWLAVVDEGIGSASFKADEAFKEMASGGGMINARKLYAESREIDATHTILLAVNPDAAMNYTDPAILNRLVSNPFNGNLDQIRKMAEVYNPSTAAWKREAPAVLAQMLEYARDFSEGKWKPLTLLDLMHAGLMSSLDDDLVLAIEMKTSTNVADWISAHRSRLTGEHTGRELYKDYELWCSGSQFGSPARGEALSETKWGRELQNVPGVVKHRYAAGMRYSVNPA